MRSGATLLLLAAALSGAQAQAQVQARYLGREVGALSQLHHGVRGRVYAVDSRTLYIHDFHYDGEGPAAYFYVGTSGKPSGAGAGAGAVRLRDERGSTAPLRRYRGEGVTLALPDGKTLRDVKWFSVWCDEYSVNFGDVSIPRELEYPRPARLGALRGVHGVASDPVVVVDAQTLLVPNFSYDGEAPDAKFWVGRGEKPSPQGIRIPDENGKEAPLRKYDKKTIVLTLPGELTVFDIGHFAVWCEAFTVDFGHVALPPAQLANVPPSLKMLGVSPQSKLNCEVLFDELAFEVRWAVAGDSIVLQLVAKLEDGEYMSFGVSGDSQHSQMVGGDVAVAWVDKQTLKGYAQDYYLDAKSQCAGVRGSCPDERLGEKTNSIRLLNAALVNGYSIVTFQRSLRAADELDRPVRTNGSQPVIWALGPLNSRNEVSYHHHFTKGDKLIEFGRPPVWNCPMPEGEGEDEQRERPPQPPQTARVPERKPTRRPENESSIIKPNPVPTPKPVPKVTPWEIPAIQCYEPPDGVFYAQMGPTGGKQGYSAITGHVGWGISWYINGLLIPEINVVRGRRYTFVVEGGSDPDTPARYHPFYITSDPVGGFYHKSEEEKKGVEIYAGVRRSRSGELLPTGVGRLCNWTPDTRGPEADEYPSFGAYQRSLTLVCEEGNPGVVTWTPDKNTPDTVYYQCFTHRYLGWKINVLDECEQDGEESKMVQTVALPDLVSEESIQVHTRVKPDSNFIDHRKKTQKIINTKTNYNDFSSDKAAGEVTGDPLRTQTIKNQYASELESPISTGQIQDVIAAVESLESRMKENIRNTPLPPPPPRAHNQYQVFEDVKESFGQERPVREEDEYTVETGKIPDTFFLPHNQKPLTLQAVLRPNGPNMPTGNMRPPFRRPVPPEIKLRRPMHQNNHHNKHAMNFPLPMPSGPAHGMKKPYKPMHGPNQYNRPPPMKRPLPGIPPMKAMPPLHHPKPMFDPAKQFPKYPSGPVQSVSVAMGKPAGNIQLPSQSQTLSLSRTDLIANQVVKSQIMLPGASDSILQSSIQQTYINQPEQIILGKPMDNPIPLDQQMIQTKIHESPKSHPTPTPVSYSTSNRVEREPNEQKEQNGIKSSDFIGESTETSSLPPAVNTGFKPNTIVIESGFKPIIREPLMDRMDDYDSTNANRREDTDVKEDYEDSPQYIVNHAYKPFKTPSDKLTESFEPMFIPSPPDHLMSSDVTKEVFPSNHAKEDRPHPVYVKSEEEFNALFSKKNMDKEVPSDMVMESDKVSPQYLPPDPKLPKEHSQKITNDEQTFTTYDGKTVSASSLTTVQDSKPPPLKMFSSRLPANTELLIKTPQFGPFKGEIPPLVDEELNKDDKPANESKVTRLRLINAYAPSELDDLKTDASEKQLFKYLVDSDYISDSGVSEEVEDENEEDLPVIPEEDKKERKRRDTKTTQFERSEGEEQATAKSDTAISNQIDFNKNSTTNASTKLHWINLVLLSTLFLNFV